jgi:DNA-directed RNA polymerase specialized sigma24 family protein
MRGRPRPVVAGNVVPHTGHVRLSLTLRSSQDGLVGGGTSRTEHRAREREAGRRDQAAADLRLIAVVAVYAAGQLADGLGPEAARRAALEMAAELEACASSLRRLTRLRPAERRALAVQLAGLGLSTQEIARQLGVTDRAVRYYISGRPCP